MSKAKATSDEIAKYRDLILAGYSVTDHDGIIYIEAPEEMRSKWNTSRFRLIEEAKDDGT